ncbi:mas-related G-protein coupled receptor member X1-like [Marmota marmota marmota]|uniref:mas-related G-protein coupled receptor member X1-like n=1 Tax=Marmota marmota marmota TaxID=9994 RepID=UPI002093C3F4|nr:mas-related G-protein coupled receptor member X1-like [Marmota marmota marmota]
MEERGTSAEMESLDPTITAWSTEATPTNGSYQHLPPTCDRNNLLPKVLALLIALVGLTGNASVLWLLGFRMRRNAFSVYILNLAASDFFFLCFHITAFLVDIVKMFFHFSVPTYDIARTGGIISYIAGLSILSAISTERCLSALWPIWYRCRRPRHMSAIMCALLWALSMFLGVLDMVYCSTLIINSGVHWCIKVDLIITAWLIFLFVTFSGSSLALLWRILCGSRHKTLTKLYVTILLTLLVFILCELPFGIYLFLSDWISVDFDAYTCLYLVSNVFSCVNSYTNPIIYFFVGSFRQRLQRQNLKLVLERALQDTPEEDECGDSLPQGSLEMSGSRVEHG